MPGNESVPDDDQVILDLEEGGSLQPETLKSRERMTTSFKDFINTETSGVTIGELLVDEEGKKRLDFLFGKFFYTMTVQVEGLDDNGEIKKKKPKLGYAMKIRSSIKTNIIEEFKVDLTDPISFPEAARRWKSFRYVFHS